MYKIVHRALMVVVAFSMFALNFLIAREFEIPMFVSFILGIPTIFIPVCLFLKVPFKCDQKNCNGAAILQINREFAGKWYRHFLVSGHRCNTCNHFIKLPRRRSSTSYDFD
ncbi:Uncharacterised protein [BD1-7 clade bacterium]|uniref:Uncharacterized protein n=1 Tax=BD1-7 clade bacterium TaxID=2029982 RepID=A0A5S9P7H8_9GAMM|nr:Uncharacterised protein [BD1-7 clade bacterium]CAA0099532.1 Uncharacterised protein [BD1-7 clade bacterium]